MTTARLEAVTLLIAQCLRTIPPPVDWKEILLDLRRAGWRLKWIAEAINAPPSTVHGWMNDGSSPEFEYGRALLALHETITKQDQQLAA